MKWAINLKPEQGRQHSLGKGSRRPLLKDPTRGSSLWAGTQLSSDSRLLTRLQRFPEKACAQGEPNHSCPQTAIFQSKTARAGAQSSADGYALSRDYSLITWLNTGETFSITTLDYWSTLGEKAEYSSACDLERPAKNNSVLTLHRYSNASNIHGIRQPDSKGYADTADQSNRRELR